MVVEEEENEGEDAVEDDGGEQCGLSPFPFEGLLLSPPFPTEKPSTFEGFSSSPFFPPEEPSPFEGLELSPYNLEFLCS